MGPCPPSRVKISHKKDGRQRRLHRFHVSWSPLPGCWIRYCEHIYVNWSVSVIYYIKVRDKPRRRRKMPRVSNQIIGRQSLYAKSCSYFAIQVIGRKNMPLCLGF